MGKRCSWPCPPAPSYSNPNSALEADTFSVGFCLLCLACAGDALDTAAPCSEVNYLRWDLSAQQIGELTVELIEQTKRVYDQVGSQKFEDVSYESTLKALADAEVSYTGKSMSGPRRGGGSAQPRGRRPTPQGEDPSARPGAAWRAGSPTHPTALVAWHT